MLKALERLHGRYVHPRRVRVLADAMAAMLPASGRVLDVGSGDGLLAREIGQRRPALHLTGVDVLVRQHTAIPVYPFDGTRLPFRDAAFDAVLCVDVLHHAADPLRLLRELARVGRRIVLKDHTRDGWLAAQRLRLMDHVGNARHGVALPCRYLSRSEWDEAFSAMGSTIEHWLPSVGLYLPPVSWVFGRGLHFVAVLRPDRAGEQQPDAGTAIASAGGRSSA